MNNPKIIKYLKDKGFKTHLSGFRYAYEAIDYCLKRPSEDIPKITVEVYPVVAKKCNTSTSKVERAIRHCIDTIPRLQVGAKTNKEFIANAIIALK